MREYTILPSASTPDWGDVPVLPIDHAQWLDPAGISAWAQLRYDASGIDVRMGAREKQIRAEEPVVLGMPCQDSCLEFFLSPAEGDARYLNIEYSPSGSLFLGFGYGRADRTRLLIPDELSLQPSFVRTQDGWEVTYHIPLALLTLFFPSVTLTPGKTMRANCYKCGDLTAHPHYLLWNPSTSAAPDFHRSCDFGLLRLG